MCAERVHRVELTEPSMQPIMQPIMQGRPGRVEYHRIYPPLHIPSPPLAYTPPAYTPRDAQAELNTIAEETERQVCAVLPACQRHAMLSMCMRC